MRQALTLVLAALLNLPGIAQVKEGRIVFEQKIDMHRRIPEDNVQMRSMIPQYRTNKFELFFGDSQSLYKMAEVEPDMTESNNTGMVIRMGAHSAITYRNFANSSIVEQRELAEKEYLIEDSLRSITWKLEDGSTTILGYSCKKATGKTDVGSEVEAWYTEEIPVSSGPDLFNGLPGMILKADINKQEFVYTATAVEKSVNKKDIKAPSKGKKITRKDFAKLRQEIFGNQTGPVRIVTN